MKTLFFILFSVFAFSAAGFQEPVFESPPAADEEAADLSLQGGKAAKRLCALPSE